MRRFPAKVFGSVMIGALSVLPVPVSAAEQGKGAADEAAAIESRLIDLQIQAGALASLQNNAQPVDTGVLAERQTMVIAPGRQNPAELDGVTREIDRLAARYRKLTGRSSGILAGGVSARQPAAGAAIASAQPGPAMSPGAQAGPQAANDGGWFGNTTVSPGFGSSGDVARGEVLPPGSDGGGWSTSRQPVTSGQAGASSAAGGWGQAPQANAGGGWGDTNGGRIGEVQPPGVPYPGTEDGGHDRALAGLDQARQPYAPPVQPHQQQQPQQQQALPGGAPLDGAEAAYEKAYGYLLQQDYGAAQLAFREFLTRHKDTALAGNAQYWLGEIHYVQGQYKDAARAFLTSYEKYGDGNKGADSLFKLALSLDKLNQATAACSSLREFFNRYGKSGEGPVDQANEVRQRLKCRS